MSDPALPWFQFYHESLDDPKVQRLPGELYKQEQPINEERDALLAQARERARSHRREREADHRWHVWINRRQEQRRQAGESWEHDLYEWKAAWEAMTGYLPHKLRQARAGTLPTVHQQCSHSAPEPIEAPTLHCALGVRVPGCPILADFYKTWQEEASHDREFAERVGRGGSDLSMEDADRVAARICAWHIFTTVLRERQGGGYRTDTSEGYAQDTSDRMFWRRVYDNLAATDDGGDA